MSHCWTLFLTGPFPSVSAGESFVYLAAQFELVRRLKRILVSFWSFFFFFSSFCRASLTLLLEFP